MFFLKKNYIVKFSTSSIFKKINKDIFETKKFKKKRRRNQFWVKKKTCKKKKTCCYSEYPTRFRVFYNDSYVILYNKKD